MIEPKLQRVRNDVKKATLGSRGRGGGAPGGMVNLRQIAERAKVSIATASRVINGSPARISDQTRKRVIDIADELGYRPNLLIRSIQQGKTRTIGVMVPPHDTFWAEVLYGIHDELYNRDHVGLFLWIHHAPGREYWQDMRDKVHRMIDQRVDGTILWPPFASLYNEFLSEFSSRSMPVVSIDYQVPAKAGVDGVGNDEEAGARLVAEHLLALGHRRFAHLGGNIEHTWAQERYGGFAKAVREVPGTDLLYAHTARDEEAFDKAVELLSHDPRPTAVFAANDRFATACYHAADHLGLRIPEDLSVVGVGDMPLSAELRPPLTTLRQQGYEIGRQAAALVVARSQNEAPSPDPVYARLPLELITRGSTGPAPKS